MHTLTPHKTVKLYQGYRWAIDYEGVNCVCAQNLDLFGCEKNMFLTGEWNDLTDAPPADQHLIKRQMD